MAGRASGPDRPCGRGPAPRRVQETGRQGLPAEAVLRCALLKQYRQLSYEELAFHLEDSASFRAFARLPWGWSPKRSVLHKTIGAIRAETWEAVNRTLLASARQEKVEDGSVVRLDSTATAALMHQPSDSSLLWDGVRVMVRLLKQAQAWLGEGARAWRDHRRAAKKRWQAIEYTRGRPKRVPLYRALIRIVRTTLAYLRDGRDAAGRVDEPGGRALAGQGPPLRAADRERDRAKRAAGAARRGGAGAGEAGQPVRDACRHHRQGQARHPVRSQAQPEHRAGAAWSSTS